MLVFLPALLYFRVRDDVALRGGCRGVAHPKVRVRSGTIVTESLYEYRRVVHRVHVSFDPVRVVLQKSDVFAVVIGSVVCTSCESQVILSIDVEGSLSFYHPSYKIRTGRCCRSFI